jgi:superfamily II DNA helicase RecQ
MQLRFFTVSVHAAGDAAAELNRFLGTHRVLTIERHLVPDGANSVWAICVGFDENAGQSTPGPQGGRRGKTDFREILNAVDFAVFSRLRELRKTQADAEGVPVYAVFTNEQLAEMVQKRVTDIAALRSVAGVSEARAEKYGAVFIETIVEAALPAHEIQPA